MDEGIVEKDTEVEETTFDTEENAVGTDTEKVDNSSEAVDVTVLEKKMKNRNTLIAILVSVLAFLIVYTGINVVETLMVSNDGEIVEDGNKKEELKDSDDIIEDESDDLVEDNDNENSAVIDGNTSDGSEFEITDDMKKEIFSITNVDLDVNQGYCEVPALFICSNSKLIDFGIEDKKRIIEYYSIVNELTTVIDSYHWIDEGTYTSVAAKYGFTESFDTMFNGYEKKDWLYLFPPSGCVTPQYLTHDVSFESFGHTVILVDNVSISNSETTDVRNVKVVYTLVYENNGFKLLQINSEW